MWRGLDEHKASIDKASQENLHQVPLLGPQRAVILDLPVVIRMHHWGSEHEIDTRFLRSLDTVYEWKQTFDSVL